MKPTDTEINIAIMWLESNEGDNGEAEACKAVAEWIAHEQRERVVAKIARRAGVTKARARRKLEEMEK